MNKNCESLYKLDCGNKLRRVFFGFSCSLALCTSLFSVTDVSAGVMVATLKELQGVIMINRGDGFAIANSGDALNAGDRIMVMEESSASVANERCVILLEGNSVYIIEQQDPCLSDRHSSRYTGTLYAAAIGIIKPKTKTEEIEKPPVSSTSDTAVSDKVVKQTPEEKTKSEATAKGLSPRAIAIGAGVAAALAALGGGGGGGGGNASTPDH